MKADNVFKFASIRPPRHANSLRFAMISTDTESELVTDVHERVEHGETLENARTDAAKDYMDSERYYKTSAHWRPFLQLTPHLGKLLAELRNNDDVERVKSRLASIFARTRSDFLIEEFIASSTVESLKQEIWDSYYANVILPGKRPHDREELVIWLVVFHILANWDSDETVLTTARYADRMRFVVPRDLMDVPVGPQVDRPIDRNPKAGEERRKKYQALTKSIEGLRRGKAVILGIYQAKLQAAMKASEEILGSVIANQQAMADRQSPRGAVDDPRRLKPEDFDKYKGVLAFLVEQEIDPFGGTVFDVVSSLEDSIAHRVAELGRMQIREILRYRDGSLVRVRFRGEPQ